MSVNRDKDKLAREITQLADGLANGVLIGAHDWRDAFYELRDRFLTSPFMPHIRAEAAEAKCAALQASLDAARKALDDSTRMPIVDWLVEQAASRSVEALPTPPTQSGETTDE